MGFEPTTPTLARLCSTPELHPHPKRGYAAKLMELRCLASYAKTGPALQPKDPQRPPGCSRSRRASSISLDACYIGAPTHIANGSWHLPDRTSAMSCRFRARSAARPCGMTALARPAMGRCSPLRCWWWSAGFSWSRASPASRGTSTAIFPNTGPAIASLARIEGAGNPPDERRSANSSRAVSMDPGFPRFAGAPG